MSTRAKHLMETYAAPFLTTLLIGFIIFYAAPSLAASSSDVDLSDGVSTATSSFKKILGTVFGIAAVVIVVGGLLLSAYKFTTRDPHAVQYLVGAIAAGAICGIVSGIL